MTSPSPACARRPRSSPPAPPPRASWSTRRSPASTQAQPELNAFRCVRADAARAEADEADRAPRRRATRLPLLGVPVAIKDDMDLAGESTNFGCAGTFHPRHGDGEVARQLRAAGAVIVGKTNTPEIGQWPFTEGPAFGATRNPWSLDHSPGGSSGGSAAAVAAGLIPAAAGSDGAGSVRIPAAWTHLVGIKPQRGRVSTWPFLSAFNGLTCIGPLARTVDDAALLLDVLAGNRPEDLHQPPPPPEPFAEAARARARQAADRALARRSRGRSRRPASTRPSASRSSGSRARSRGSATTSRRPIRATASSASASCLDRRAGFASGSSCTCRIMRSSTPAPAARCSSAGSSARCCASRTRSSGRCTRTSGGSSAASTSC